MGHKFTTILDTSLKGISLALCRTENAEVSFVASQQYYTSQIAASKISSLWSHLLEVHDLDANQISDFIVVSGPGSFTGVKVGMAFAQGLKLAQPSMQFAAISALEQAALLNPQSAWFLPATKSQGYAAFVLNNQPVMSVVDVANGDIRLLQEESRREVDLASISDKTFRLLLPWEKFTKLNRDCGRSIVALSLPESMAVYQNAIKSSLEAGLSLSQYGVLNPRYIRKSAPEEALDQQNRQQNSSK